MILSAEFPLRISLAGGGTDLEPYVSECGGQVVNFGINKFIRINIIDKNSAQNSLTIRNMNLNREVEVILENLILNDDRDFRIPLACLLAFKKYFPSLNIGGLIIQFSSDVKMGSGLGASSILAAGMISSLNRKFMTNLKESDIVEISKFAESDLLNLSGGLQDYWSACNSNLKTLIFAKNDKTLINEIPLDSETMAQLSQSLIMLNTNVSRVSGDIIEDQMKSMQESKVASYESLDRLKFSAAYCEKVLVEKRNLDALGEILNTSWENKKKLSSKASIPEIDALRLNLLRLGASGAKICGAGGGGFLLVYLNKKRNLDGFFSYIETNHYSWESIDFASNGPKFRFKNV